MRATTTWGAMLARAEVVRPDGVTDCAPGINPCVLDVAGAVDEFTCVLDASGTHTLIACVRLVATTGASTRTPRSCGPTAARSAGAPPTTSFSCPVDSDGTYTILVSDDTGLNTGRYEIWSPPVITSGTISGGK